MVRSSYGIGNTTSRSCCTQDSCNDCLITNCCFHCSVNQIYQTVKSKGPPSPTSGFYFNKTPFSPVINICEGVSCCEASSNLAFIVCCPCCKIGSLMESSIGMPWCMGCCCIPIFAVRNIIRYQYRISPVINQSFCECWPQYNECVEECVWPSLIYCLVPALCTALCTASDTLAGCGSCGVIWAYEIGVIISLDKEVSLRKDRNQQLYLIGFDPLNTLNDPNTFLPV